MSLFPRAVLIRWLISEGANRPDPLLLPKDISEGPSQLQSCPWIWLTLLVDFISANFTFCSILHSLPKTLILKEDLVNLLHVNLYIQVYFLTNQHTPLSLTFACFQLSPYFFWLIFRAKLKIPLIFFIHSCINRHLDCFHIFSIVNSAAMGKEYKYVFEILAAVILYKTLGIGVLFLVYNNI